MVDICRTCMHETSVTNFFNLTKDEKSAQIKIEMLLCLPELNLDLLINPGLCTPCIAALNASFRFKKQCLYTEERIRSYLSRTKNTQDTKISDVYSSRNTFSVNINTTDVKPVKRSYMDDLNDLLDDALNESTPSHPLIPEIKQEKEADVILSEKQTATVEPTENNPEPTSVLDSEQTINPPTKTRKCRSCSFVAQDLSAFKEHKKGHRTLFPCGTCSFKTNFKSSLKKHRELHLTRSVLTCTKCKYSTLNKGDLMKHSMHKHKDAGPKNKHPIKNDSTPKEIPDSDSKEDLSKKVSAINGKKPLPSKQIQKKSISLECCFCSFCCKKQSDLKVHLLEMHNNSMYLCLLCKRVFKSDFFLKLHSAVHATGSKGTSNSNKNTDANSRKVSYIITKSGKVYVCRLCEFRHNCAQAYSAHMRIHKKM